MVDSRVVGVVDVSDSPTTPLLGTSTPPQPTTQPNYSPNPQILNYSTMEQQPQQQHMEERKDDAVARSSSAPPSSSNGLAGGDKVLLKSIEWNWNRMHTPSPQTTTLTQRSISLTIGSKSTHFPLEDVIGVERQGSNLLVHSYPVDQGCCAGDRPIRKHSLTTLTPNQTTTNEQADQLANAWHQQLESILNHTWMSQHPSDDNRQRRSIMILINPASGAGNAAANLQTLTPMLKQSGISYQVMNTTHANHAFELMRDLNVDADNCPTDVVCVSGDGLVHEVINGMMQRPDWGKLVRRIRLGHIGGGSGNGLSSSICHQAGERIDIVSSMYLILKGYTRPFDVMSIKQDGEPLRYGFLSLSYGLISDIDLESESMRYLGNARFATAFLLRLCCRRQYEARIEYVPYDSTDSIEPGESRSYPLCQHAENGCPSCGIQYGGIQSTEVDHPQQRGRYELEQYIESITQDLNQIVIEPNPTGSDDKGDVPSAAAAAAAAASSSSSSISPSSPPLRWYSIDDLFTLVWSMNVSHGASDLHVSPSSHFSDGCMDMLFVRDIGRCSSVSMFLKMEDGTHMTNSNLSKIKVRALRLQPNLKLRSDLNIDGERFPFKTMEMRVHRGVLNLLAK